MSSMNIPPHQTRKIVAQLQPESQNRFLASFSSETPVKRSFGNEVLIHDEASMDMSRARDGKLPLLAFHDQQSWPIGYVENFRLDAKNRVTRGAIVFADTKRAQEPLSLYRQGVPLELSIGYDLDIETVTHDAATDTYRFRWTPAEVSLLPLGADPTIGIGRAKDNRREAKDHLMSDENVVETTPVDVVKDAPVFELSKARREHVLAKKVGAQEAVKAERQRVTDIHELFDLDLVPRNDFYAGLRMRAVDEGWPLDGARKILMEALSGEVEPAVEWADAGQRAVQPATHDGRLPPVVLPEKPSNKQRGLGQTTVTHDAKDKFAEGMIGGLLIRAGMITDRNEIGKARQGGMIGKSLNSLAGEFLRVVGESTVSMSDEDMAVRAFAYRAVGATTSDFSNILANVANKSMMMGWDESPETWAMWTRRGQLPDFKTAEISGISGFTGLDAVPEDGDITYGKFTDRKETIKLVQYAKKYRLSRQAIINDDLRHFTAVPRAMGRAAQAKVGDVVYALLDGTGPTLNQDSTTLWNTANHKNYVAAATAPTVATLGTATVAMARQKDPNSSRVLNIRPRYLLVPVTLEATARTLMSSMYDPAGTAGTLTPNPYNGRFEVVTDARLDEQANGTAAWYLLGDPNVYDTVEVAFLNGVAEPYMRENPDWAGQGVEYMVGVDFGVSALDFRAMHKYKGNT